MDISKRDALVDRVGTHVSLEEFFDGNDDGGSIWCNLDGAPEPNEVYQALLQIRERDHVSDVRILITQYDGDDDEWPFSDTVLVVTSSKVEDVLNWLGDRYAPDDCSIDPNWTEDEMTIPKGSHVVRAWWD